MAKVLLGFMGAGKTTVAGELQESFDQFLDMDLIIEERIGMSISEYFAREGEASFRKIESQVLEELLALEGNIIISTGGGVVISEHNRELLRANRKNNVLLAASFEVLYDRIEHDKIFQRPLFLNNSKEDFHGIYERRMKLYEGLSDLIINTDHRTPKEIARIIECM
ncbi:shikimate kinase [Streptococcus ratti]|uniref:Shikimate kinase n=2 Tax=Streptococcus ratti TaxID=1341 RepID=A0A7X9LFP1_STRRT|nr:shikimate kinase [Streptococcus ratti]VEI59954.1 shikimate kinase [Streptococcus mutans]EJN93639.1 shikimate kinase [Streptococcus ratti FA-1 = DSM 20564]EMP71268.1 shikimate kinase [Streptococcus ratti FA-1 = DSM 20564]NMD49987.1 shikimate kinase [Streptococcus ratti]QEY07505.1 shikimate kinase [Streptococcus ratti]